MTNNEQWHMARAAAENYERVVARYVLGPWAPLLVDAAQVARGQCVLDLACGTGVVARVAAQRVGPDGRIVGVDLNPGMIDVARCLPAPGGASIEWLEGSALAIPLPDASVDVVLCQQGLQFFPDKELALRQMYRVLRRRGRLALSVWSNTGFYNSAVGRALARFVGQDVACRFCASRNAPGSDELERLAASAGFSGVNVRIRRMNVHLPPLDRFALEHLAATPVAGSLEALDTESRNRIGASVLAELQRFNDGDGVTYPEETYVLTARV
jgi:ubiquinone/menaquinone biosynthesis C-methylase UbiE